MLRRSARHAGAAGVGTARPGYVFSVGDAAPEGKTVMSELLSHANILRSVSEFAAQAEADGGPHLCIAVCDAVGDLLHYTRMRAAARRGTPIARAKAYTAAVLETSTGALHARLEREGLSLADFCDGSLTSLAGGVPLTLDGRTVGGVGVSGRKPEEDEILALRLAEALLR